MNKPAITVIDSNGDTYPLDAIDRGTVRAIVPQDPPAGGSYRRNADGTLTCVQQTEAGPHDGRRRHATPPAPATHNDAYQE